MDSIQALEKRVAPLANHHQKYIHTLRRNLDSLTATLESSGKLMQVHLWSLSSSVEDEMKLIAGLTSDRTTNIRHISCYYALQFLHMNFRHQDILTLWISSGAIPETVYQQFMMNVGADFRKLTRAYLGTLFDLYLPSRGTRDIIICSVGTRADQDDLDLGIITRDSSEDEPINNAIKNIAHDMLVYATPLHLYLSEHVSEQLYTTTVSAYLALLEPEIQDVVIISELLGARLILGDEDLFREFQEKVISRYYYDPGRDIRYHEGFLRGILGEARALLLTPLETDTISPKDDALRIIKGLIAAKKVIHGIQEVNAWEIITALKEKEPALRSQYEFLFKALALIEILKFQLHLYVAQEDSIRPKEIDPNQLAQLAEMMGYRPIGAVGSWDQLIIDYYRYVKEARTLCDFLLEDISKHLSSVSLFMRMFGTESEEEPGGTYTGVLAKDFIETARFFRGVRYWEDVLDLLESDPDLQSRFVDSFETLEDETRNSVIDEYTEWAQYSPITLMRLITIMFKKQQNILGDTIAVRMSRVFLEKMERLPYITERLSKIITRYPQYIHEYLEYLPEPHYDYLFRILDRPVADERLEPYLGRLRNLCEIHNWSGQYFGRFFSRVIASHPEYLTSLGNSQQLNEIATGLLALADVYPRLEDRKQALGQYYDLEFLRIGLGTMRGADLRITNLEFTEFCDNYMRRLFDVCTAEVEQESAAEPPGTDMFAVLAAGGHAREQAYDDDYDLIAFVDTDDEEVISYATRIMTKMNREILKRGLLPQYRLGEILGGFVNPLSQVTDYLASDDRENFIDLSQLLGARVLVGSKKMEMVLQEQVLDRFVFSRKADYIRQMISEIRNRQEIVGSCANDTCNLKETTGGLRDIEAVALMLKAYLEIHSPISQDFFQEIRPRVPRIEAELDTLSGSMYYLRTIRDLYRITVAAEDSIQPEYLARVGTIFRQSYRPEWSDPELIIKQVLTTLESSASAVDDIIRFLETQV